MEAIQTNNIQSNSFKEYAKIAAALTMNVAVNQIKPLTGIQALRYLANAQHKLFEIQLVINSGKYDDATPHIVETIRYLSSFAYSHLGQLKESWWNDLNEICAIPQYSILNVKDEYDELLTRWSKFSTSILSSEKEILDLLTPTFRNEFTSAFKPILESFVAILTILHKWPLTVLDEDLNNHLLHHTKKWILLTESE